VAPTELPCPEISDPILMLALTPPDQPQRLLWVGGE
jgi:hypothetical protein